VRQKDNLINSGLAIKRFSGFAPATAGWLEMNAFGAGRERGRRQYPEIAVSSDQYRPAATGLNVRDATQDQRADDALAELGFSHDQRPKPIGRNQQCFEIIICSQAGTWSEMKRLLERL
jgi:hypothetical protein